LQKILVKKILRKNEWKLICHLATLLTLSSIATWLPIELEEKIELRGSICHLAT